MQHFRPNPRNETGALTFPLLLSSFMMIAVTAPCAMFQLANFHTHAWHRLPSVEGGIPLSTWNNYRAGGWAEAAQIDIDLFSKNEHSILMVQGNYYSIDGDYDEMSGCIGYGPYVPWNLENLGTHLVNRHNYVQARWNLPNREDGAKLISALLRIDNDAPMRDVDRILETLERVGVSDINFVGARAKNP